MAAAYVKKKASEGSPWGAEFAAQAGKDSEVLDSQRQLLTFPATKGSDISAWPMFPTWHPREMGSTSGRYFRKSDRIRFALR